MRTPNRSKSGGRVALAAAAGLAASALYGAVTAQAGSPTPTSIDQGTTVTLGKAHGLVYRTADSQFVGVGESRGVEARCGGKRKTTGGGAAVGGTLGGQASPADSGPTLGFSSGRSWVATFTNEPSGQSTFVRASVICGKLEGRVVRKMTVADASPNVELDVRARCPQDTHVTGGGVDYADDSSQSRILAPFDGNDDDAKPDDGWRVVAYPAGSGGVTAIAICARGKYAYRQANTAGPFGETSHVIDQANCRDDQAVTGGGVNVGGASPTARWVSGGPGDNDFDGAPDDAWKASYMLPAGSIANSIAICKRL